MSEPYPSKLTANMKKKARSGGLLSIWRNRYFVLENGVISYYEKVRGCLSIYPFIYSSNHSYAHVNDYVFVFIRRYMKTFKNIIRDKWHWMVHISKIIMLEGKLFTLLLLCMYMYTYNKDNQLTSSLPDITSVALLILMRNNRLSL